MLETLNPSCWMAFFESHIRDITHRWPLHPDTLEYLVTASGFRSVRVEFRSAIPSDHRLRPIQLPPQSPEILHEMVETVNGNVEKLNSRIFSFMD